MSPGPNFAFMLRTAFGSGRLAALRATLGIALGEAIWGVGAVFGVAALALRYPVIGTLIRWGGGVFLLYLAVAALRAAWAGETSETVEVGALIAGGGFGAGLTIMLLNPKAGFFWISLTGVLIGPEVTIATGLVAVTGAVLLSVLWHGALALAFSGVRVARLYARARRGIEALLGMALTALGLRLLAAN